MPTKYDERYNKTPEEKVEEVYDEDFDDSENSEE